MRNKLLLLLILLTHLIICSEKTFKVSLRKSNIAVPEKVETYQNSLRQKYMKWGYDELGSTNNIYI